MSKARKILFMGGLIVLTYLLCESLSFVGLSLLCHHRFSFKEFQAERQAIVSAAPLKRPGEPGILKREKRSEPKSEVIHPYLGFVWDPNVQARMNDFGFLGEAPPLEHQETGQIVVGVFGGSVAGGLANLGGTVLKKRLAEIPRFLGGDVRIYDLCIDGYKQPQQLMTLAYFLSLGARFDVVINLDGFNEVVIPPVQNIPKRVFPFFPRLWFGRVQGQGFDTPSLALLGEIALSDRRRRDWAHMVSASPLRLNVTCNMIWRIYDRMLLARRTRQIIAFEEFEITSKEQIGYLTTGPSFSYDTEDEMYQDLARVWRRCSIQMFRVCSANGISYFHFLQPNQYLPGSKPLSKAEQDYAFRSDHPYRPGVVGGYPFLKNEIEAIRSAGVFFRDLSMMFEHTHKTLYRDDCCHFTKEGYGIIASEIAAVIRDYYADNGYLMYQNP